MIDRRVCAFHADEDILGTPMKDELGTYVFVCERKSGHPVAGPHTWMSAPEPPDAAGLSGLAEELRLDVELPAALARCSGRWIQYGVLEAAYADANPGDFGRLVTRYGHTAIRATQYTPRPSSLPRWATSADAESSCSIPVPQRSVELQRADLMVVVGS